MTSIDVEDHEDLAVEFDRQASVLIERNYPRAAGLTRTDFMAHVAPLREALSDLATSYEPPGKGPIRFVLVIKNELVGADRTIELVQRRGRAGFSVMDANEIAGFKPIETVSLPEGLVYLMTDVDTGEDTLNVTPDVALDAIDGRRRSPLTIDEGVALITHYPETVAKGRGFSLLGSRCGDRRVTALWISEGRPRLGWCWAGNPHTWLGSASCGSRVGA